MKLTKTALWTSAALIGLALIVTAPASADQQILDDLIVDGSICVGLDCVNGESFGFDTLRLKENNLRIKFLDTSTSASFPSNDWQLTANDSANGGANKFSIDDIDHGRTPFTIEASAPSHSLYVDDGGRLGLGTSTPVVDLHVKSGNTPTLRLEQDGSSGFGAQIWDVAGNEANFFIRDASNGSTLPFRIFPGAPSNALDVEASGDIGIGTTSPAAAAHVRRTTARTEPMMLLENTSTGNTTLQVTNSGAVNTEIVLQNSAREWKFRNNTAGTFVINDPASGAGGTFELMLTNTGDLTVQGQVAANSGADTLPDYVFEPDYSLMPLDELAEFVVENKHLPRIPSQDEVNANNGTINMTEMQLRLLEKVEELTLYTLEQHDTIQALEARLGALEQPE